MKKFLLGLLITGITCSALGDMALLLPKVQVVQSYTNTVTPILSIGSFIAVVGTSAVTNTAPVGIPYNGQKLLFRYYSASAQDLQWATNWVDVVTKPVVTVAEKYLYISFIYNEARTSWDCIGVLQE